VSRFAACLALMLALALAGLCGLGDLGLGPRLAEARGPAVAQVPVISASELPAEARHTLQLIARGGPFPYPHKDGSVFGNFEKRLPLAERGYYREYTVPTPGAGDRGARRIVAGGQPPSEFFYTADHYQTWHRIVAP
jgi:ribonuclease T1